MDIYERSLELHRRTQGKLEVRSRVRLEPTDDLSLAYTPGVARPSEEIAKRPGAAWELTWKGRTVAVVSDGSSVLGLGDIGPAAALPVMEGKAILFQEFAGVDAFSRKVVEWQEWEGAPWSLIMAIARQTWDEVRHAKLATGVLESYGGKIGEYPDTLAGGAGGAAPPPASQQSKEAPAGTAGRVVGGAGISDPIMMLSAVNVSLEGGALTLFKETSNLGKRIGDPLLERCFDYNWADEVTHTTIGDFFIKLLAEKNPETEQKALRVHGMSEFGRSRLSGDQTQELKDFFAEEMQRAQAALGGDAASND